MVRVTQTIANCSPKQFILENYKLLIFVAIFITNSFWKQPRCPTTDE
jgi:hypothetical protein